MGTTADKLARLNETKVLLKTRLADKGLDVASEDNFYNLADKVGEIQSGFNIETVTITNDYGEEVYCCRIDEQGRLFPSYRFNSGSVTSIKKSFITIRGGGTSPPRFDPEDSIGGIFDFSDDGLSYEILGSFVISKRQAN